MKIALVTLFSVTVLLFAISVIAADKVVVIPLGGKKTSIVCTDVSLYCESVASNSCEFNNEACCQGQYGKSCAATLADCKAVITSEAGCYTIGYCNAKAGACISISNKLSE